MKSVSPPETRLAKGSCGARAHTVLAPGAAQLAKLRTAWESWERDHPAPEAKAAANLDRAVFNLSSIVVLARSSDRTLLLTGDARSDDVVERPAGGRPAR